MGDCSPGSSMVWSVCINSIVSMEGGAVSAGITPARLVVTVAKVNPVARKIDFIFVSIAFEKVPAIEF